MTISRKKLAVRAAFVVAGFLGLAVLTVGGFAAWLYNADLKPLVERQASDALQRHVTFGTFTVGWGDPLAIEFSDLRIANTSWGSVPDMVSIGHLSARIDVRALLRGVLRYENLRVEDATVVLEREPAGVGNWKLPISGLGGGLAIVPKNRTQFPTLIDFVLAHGLVTYRTSSGKILRIAMNRVLSHTQGDDMPIVLQLDGAANDVAATLDGLMQSASVLRDAGTPYGAKLTVAAGDTKVAFDGTLTEPVDFDGVQGPLTLDAATLNGLLKLFGVDARADLSLAIAGQFKRDGDDWSLSKASGKLAKNAFGGALALHEGGRGAPDDISTDLVSKTLDIDAIVSQIGDGKSTQDVASTPLQMDLTGINLAAKLAADQVKVAAMRFAAVNVDGRLAGGDVSLRTLGFALAGGTINASGSLKQVKAAGHLALTAFLTGAEADALAKMLGAAGGEIRGRLDGGATLDVTGKTLGTALKTSRGAAILTMSDGNVARDLLEQISVDLRNLFRVGEGRVPINCLLGVMTLKNGIGVLSPLRLDSQEATLVGAGSIDFAGQRLDLKLQSDHDTTGFFALDVPISISGPFKRLAVTPLSDGDEHWLDKADGNGAVEALPAALHKLASGSTCAG